MKKRCDWLKQRREELKSLDKKKFSIRALAERVGISSAAISHLENHDVMPALDLAMNLARELDRPVEWVLTGVDITRIPIIGTTMSGPDLEWFSSDDKNSGYSEYVNLTVSGKRLYGLKVVGDHSCGYNEGEVVVIDMDGELITGEDVAVVIDGNNGSCVRILASMRNEQLFLDSPVDRNQRLISDRDKIISIHPVIFVAKSHTIRSV